jgi:AcrR family transcriptional regulator
MNGRRQPRGPYAKTRERRAAISAAALALVIEKGHRNVTTTEVAARAEVTEATVLYHFPTKDHLLVAAKQADDDTTAETWGTLEEVSAHGFEELLATAIQRGIGRPNTLRLLMSLSADACDPEHPAHAYIERRQMDVAAYFSEILRRQQATGLAHPDIDPEPFGRQMIAVWDGLQAQWLVNPSFDLANEVIEAFRRLTRQEAMQAKRAMNELAAQL